MTEKAIGFEVEVWCGADAAAVTATIELGGVINISPPEWSRDAVDVTDSDSPGRTREFIGGMIDSGEMSIEMSFDPNSTTETEVQQMKGETVGRLFEVRFPQFATKRKASFLGLLTGVSAVTPQDNRLTQTITLKVSGAVTWATYV